MRKWLCKIGWHKWFIEARRQTVGLIYLDVVCTRCGEKRTIISSYDSRAQWWEPR